MNRGLIEAVALSLRAKPLSQLPRFMNRGLIEAASRVAPASRRCVLPRFMNRGLIEAARLTTASKSCWNFPDS